ncbi:V-type proton ATPase subunit C [Papilio xuthus]|uniref:V-type proton ATPase subunit C n=1 Tax=Papilio xuthus TaxID=66420 RepID=A0A194Q0U2_PAPXU|nr:V-type proton ATPase subunit C [Papilio xuthus]
MSEYWLISAPGDKTCQQTWDTLNNATKSGNLSVNYKFPIPDLKVGTLDQLVGLSDDLGKLDTFVESVTRKVAQYLGEVLEDQRDKLHENLMANNKSITNTQYRMPIHKNTLLGQIVNVARAKVKRAVGLTRSPRTKSATPTPSVRTAGETCGDPGGGEPPPTPTSPVCDSAYSDQHGCWPCEHHQHSEGEASQPSSGRCSPRWDEEDDDERTHHILTQGQDRPYPKPHIPSDLPTYLTRFQWDMAKYPIKQSLRNIADIISKQVGQIDADLKVKSSAYNALKGNLQNLEKKQTGSLLTRNLADLVKKEHFILDSEYLTTLLVIVPKSLFNDWNANYEKITNMIVPRSTQLIHQDNDYGLFTVTLFKKVVEEFKLHARERKFVVREFSYNEADLAAGKNEITKLVTDKKKQFGPLVRWLKVNFSECFCAWIHVKALRVFVESVLRYGLPVNFQAAVVVPARKSMKKLRDVLQQLYAHLDHSAQQGHAQASENVEIAGLGFGQSEYFPYVFYKINIDMIEKAVFNWTNVEIAGLGFGQSEYFPYVFYKINIDMIEKAV